MKSKMKKYPLLISTIVSCLLIIVSLFILGFFGMRLGVSLGGGTQIEVVMNDGINASDYTSKVGTILKKYNYTIDSNVVQDKFVAGEDQTKFSKKTLIIQVASKMDDETSNKIRNEIVSELGLGENEKYVSVGNITSSVASKNILFLGLAFGILAVCFFIFGWIRYGIFAGLSFIIAFLHNIILFLSVVILTRLQLSITALSALMFLTLVMSAVLITIYERFRVNSTKQDYQKMPVQERMLKSEFEVVKPYGIVAVAIVVLTLCMFFVPIAKMAIIATNILIAILVTVYTTLLIGPSSYVACLEIHEMNEKAVLSRNHTVNKAIKKKIAANTNKNDAK